MAVNRIRAFNRFYTQKIGLITNRFLHSEYTLVQARLLFELHRTPRVFAADLAKIFKLGPDYLSKVISRFEAQGLVSRTPAPRDARKQLLSLTPEGKKAYARLRKRSDAQIRGMIEDLAPEERNRLVSAMDTIKTLLEPGKKESPLVTVRPHRPGDIGMVIHRHGVLYAREYGFNHEFDAYVALGMARFIQSLSPGEFLWVAEVDNRFAGSVAVVRHNDRTAQLRWLIVEPGYRKKGIGKQLIREAVRFSREKGYRSMILWTIDFLHPARHLYAQAGFTLTKTKQSQVWGKTLTEECWELVLA